MGPAFAVLGLPRSGTTWAANWLTDAGAICLHDPIADMTPGQVLDADIGRRFGISCSGLWLFEGIAEKLAERVPVVVIASRPDQSNASLQAMGLPTLPAWMHERFAAVPGLRVPASGLWSEPWAYAIWRYLRPDAPFDVDRWRLLRDMRVAPMLERQGQCRGTIDAIKREYRVRGFAVG